MCSCVVSNVLAGSTLPTSHRVFMVTFLRTLPSKKSGFIFICIGLPAHHRYNTHNTIFGKLIRVHQLIKKPFILSICHHFQRLILNQKWGWLSGTLLFVIARCNFVSSIGLLLITVAQFTCSYRSYCYLQLHGLLRVTVATTSNSSMVHYGLQNTMHA